MITLDIETLPTTDPEIIADLEAGIKAPATYKKPESIAEWLKENKESALKELVAKTSFSGLHGRIACVCYAFDDEDEVFCVDDDDERYLLENLYTHIYDRTSFAIHNSAVEGNATLVGHNIVGFDLPFIKHRSIINQVKPISVFRKAFDAKPWGGEVADTMLMWSADREKRASMDKLCKAFGLAGKGDFNGSMVADTWPVDRQKVIDYCKDDVRRTREMYKRITFNF